MSLLEIRVCLYCTIIASVMWGHVTKVCICVFFRLQTKICLNVKKKKKGKDKKISGDSYNYSNRPGLIVLMHGVPGMVWFI